jgi:hypothetical protein
MQAYAMQHPPASAEKAPAAEKSSSEPKKKGGKKIEHSLDRSPAPAQHNFIKQVLDHTGFVLRFSLRSHHSGAGWLLQ